MTGEESATPSRAVLPVGTRSRAVVDERTSPDPREVTGEPLHLELAVNSSSPTAFGSRFQPAAFSPVEWICCDFTVTTVVIGMKSIV